MNGTVLSNSTVGFLAVGALHNPLLALLSWEWMARYRLFIPVNPYTRSKVESLRLLKQFWHSYETLAAWRRCNTKKYSFEGLTHSLVNDMSSASTETSLHSSLPIRNPKQPEDAVRSRNAQRRIYLKLLSLPLLAVVQKHITTSTYPEHPNE